MHTTVFLYCTHAQNHLATKQLLFKIAELEIVQVFWFTEGVILLIHADFNEMNCCHPK